MKKRRVEIDILYAIIVIIVIITTGTIFYHVKENLSWLDASYFTVMTLLTVGYGDFAPHKPISKIFTMVYALISIPAILFCLGLIVNDFIKQRMDQIEDKVNQVIEEESLLKKELEERKWLNFLKFWHRLFSLRL